MTVPIVVKKELTYKAVNYEIKTKTYSRVPNKRLPAYFFPENLPIAPLSLVPAAFPRLLNSVLCESNS